MIPYTNLLIAIDILCIFIVALILLNFFTTGDKSTHNSKLMECLLFIQLGGLVLEIVSSCVKFSNNQMLTAVFYFLQYTCWYVLISLFIHYAVCAVNMDFQLARILFVTVDIVNLISILLCFLNIFTGAIFTVLPAGIVKGKLYYFEKVFPLTIAGYSALLLLVNEKRTIKYKLSLLSYILFPVLSLVLEYFFDFVSIRFFGTTLALLIIYLNVQGQLSRELLKKQNEVTQNNMSIMLTQIQPHFLYNTLSAIMMLCDEQPEKVKSAIADFGKYLRVNLDSLKHTEPIPFEKELEHVNIYLKFEKLRFEEKIKVEYEIKSLDFLVPALSIQPIVENAVRHGICPNDKGGTLKISTEQNDFSYIIIISDDGVGFDVNKLNLSGEEHHSDSETIGLRNVKNRLAAMVNGSMRVESRIGKGTKVTITIPRTRI